jgi:hypothetical protein
MSADRKRATGISLFSAILRIKTKFGFVRSVTVGNPLETLLITVLATSAVWIAIIAYARSRAATAGFILATDRLNALCDELDDALEAMAELLAEIDFDRGDVETRPTLQ